MEKRAGQGLRVRQPPADHLGVLIRLRVYRELLAELRGARGESAERGGDSPLEEGEEKKDARTYRGSYRYEGSRMGRRRKAAGA